MGWAAVSIYERFGLNPIINVSGAVTRLGGAPMAPETLDAFQLAAAECVPLEQLQAVACRRIAEATGTEAGIVTCGAAAALTLGTAAILAGLDLAKMERLPRCEGFPHELVVAREQRNGYDHAARAAGATLVEVGCNELVAGSGVRRTEAWEYEAAIGPRTAGVLYVLTGDSRPPLAQVVELAHRHHLPVLVDAAGELPPRANLQAIAASGADLVAFSGGKAIRGPQATGILCGRRELIASAALQMLDMDDHHELWDPPRELFDRDRLPGLPRQGIGRGYKVSKEQIVALLVALEAFQRGDYDRHLADYQRQLEKIAAALAAAPVTCRIQASDGEHLPILEIAVDEAELGRTALEVCHRLRAGDPPCYLGHAQLHAGVLTVNPLHLNDERTGRLIERLRQELRG
jgi:D-glucosaminate-6-phosphate ammonia-lyase